MVQQLVVRITDDLAGELDRLVAEGVVRSRSEAVRIGLSDLLEARRREMIGQAIVEGYQRIPADEEFDALAEGSVRSMIAEEPW